MTNISYFPDVVGHLMSLTVPFPFQTCDFHFPEGRMMAAAAAMEQQQQHEAADHHSRSSHLLLNGSSRSLVGHGHGYGHDHHHQTAGMTPSMPHGHTDDARYDLRSIKNVISTGLGKRSGP